MDAFERGARYYEAFANAAGRLEREGPLLRRLLDEIGARPVLDLACGTGIHARYLAEQGATVEAVDVSAGMVAFAGENRPHPNVTYRVHDMRAPLGGTYGLILCIGNSLSLLDDEELGTALANIARALDEGGQFLFQILNYALPANQASRCRVEERSVGDGTVTAVKCLAPRDGRTYLTLTYFVEDGNESETVSEAAVLRNRSLEELEVALQAAGLAPLEVLGGFDGRPFDPGTSPDLLMRCGRG